MLYKTYALFLGTLFAFALPICAIAQDHLAEVGHPGGHDFQHHHAALFDGVATNFQHHFTDFVVGAEYEYRFAEKIGAGVLSELLLGEEREIFTGIPIAVHPIGGFKIMAAPMLTFAEEVEHTEGANHHEVETTAWKSHFAFRAEAAYDFHLGKLTLGPVANLDLIAGNTFLNYGVALGVGF